MAEETTPAPADNAAAAGGAPEGIDPAVWEMGKQVYETPGGCITCHQADGNGLPAAFPPLAGSEWVTGPAENLIRIQLRGLTGAIEVKGETFNSVMPPSVTLNDEQIAAVLTYVRNNFGNEGSPVTPDMVAEFAGEKGQPMLTVADLKDPSEAVEEEKPTTVSPEELKGAVQGSIPKADSYLSFPGGIAAIVFLVVIAGAAGKLLLGKS
ncbi:c-type cytochrome [Roseibacillus ishigakijimensis]|uniref:Cytochrome c n=1 Tax=Roseibacillus ishigakijimensis TaxID=454146 RepID=A0A934RQ36_9BACT|nr:cytochrome c [Roseibacillus ishigakijimensis]MBK1832461.1 cytochrome c [Roseibacillus ishigakijimensis]